MKAQENTVIDEPKVKKVEITYKTTKAQREAMQKYEANTVDRINCRFPKELQIKERIQATGESVNSFIIKAVTHELEKIEKEEKKNKKKKEQDGAISAEKADESAI